MNKDIVGCSLQISGDSEKFFDDIAQTVGIQPSKVYKKGETVEGQPARTHKTNLWILESGLADEDLEEEHLDALLEQLKPYAQGLKKLFEKYEAHIEIYSTKYSPHLGVFIEKEQVKMLAELNLSLGIDSYILTPTYLGEPTKIEELTSKLSTLKLLPKEKAQKTISALAIIEENAGVLNDLVGDLDNEYLDTDSIKEVLQQIDGRLSQIYVSLDGRKT